MHKPAAIAISTLISVSLFQPVWADNNRRPVAVVPGMVLPMPVSARAGLPLSAVRSAVKRAAKTSYPANHFQRGMYLKQKGNLDAALVEFLKAAQENPMQVRAFYEQAILFKQKGYNKLAQSSLQQALSVKPDFRDARVLLASIFLEGGEFSEAARELFDSLGLHSEAQKVKSKPTSQTVASPLAKLPTLIQTPHGTMKPPVLETPALETPAVNRTTPDAFQQGQPSAPLGGLSALLKGIPGVDPDVSEAGTALSDTASQKASAPPPVALAQPNATDKRVVTGQQLSDSSSRQVEDLLRQVHKQAKGFKIFSPFGWFDRTGVTPPPAASSIPPVLPDVPESDAGTEETAVPEPISVKEPPSAALTAAQSDKNIEQKFRRQRKPRVATWLDNMLDGRHQIGLDPQERQEELKTAERTAKAPHPPSTVGSKLKVARVDAPEVVYHVYPQQSQSEPVSNVPVQSTFLEQSGEEQVIVEPANLERAAVTAPVRVVRTALNNSVAAPGPKSTPLLEAPGNVVAQQAQKESWIPAPIDVSRLIQKAVAWMPLPAFRPFASGASPPSAATAPFSSSVSAVGPTPLKPKTPAAAALQLKLKAIACRKPAIAAPVPGQVASVAPILPALPQYEGAASTMKNVMSMLPKDLAATLKQVLGPQPVDIAAQPGSVPPLMEVARSVSVSAPAPKPATNVNVYENLVAAQLKVPASIAQPVPRPPASERTAMPAPGASSFVPLAVRQAAPVVGISSALPQAPAAIVQSARYSAAPVAQEIGQTGARVPATLPLPQPGAVANQHRIPMPQAMQGSELAAGAPPLVAGANPGNYVGVTPAPLAISASDVQVPHLVATSAAGHVPAPVPLPQSARQSFTPATLPVAARLANQGFKFMAPSLTNNKQYVFNSFKSGAVKGKPVTAAPKIAPVQPPAPPDDEFAKRMKYLLTHGTASLGPGEAFMFSEETGEGVMFLSNRSSVRRKIAVARDAVAVARQRRPELLAPQGELQYNLSLLGKIIKPKADLKAQPAAAPSSANPTVNELFEKQDGFFSWFKSVFKL